MENAKSPSLSRAAPQITTHKDLLAAYATALHEALLLREMGVFSKETATSLEMLLADVESARK